MSTVRVEVPLILKQAIERFHRRGDDVNALYARLFGFQNEVRQKWNVDQRQRLLRNEGARRTSVCQGPPPPRVRLEPWSWSP